MASESRYTDPLTYEDELEPIVLTESTPQSLSQAVHARRAEYTRPHTLKLKIGTWNVAACPGVHEDVGAWFVEGKGIDKRLAGLDVSEGIKEDGSQDLIESVTEQEARRSKKQSTEPIGDQGTIVGGSDIGLYVLGLQEVVVLASAKEYIGRVYTDAGPLTKWKRALDQAMPEGYQFVAEQQLSGMLILIYASPEIAPSISSVSSVPVGTGIMGYLGNKGAVSTRIVLGETTSLVFVDSHLASGTDLTHLDRRCWDVSQILTRTRFDPISRAGVLEDVNEGIGDGDFAFWFGDLNFRLDGLPGDDIRRLLMLHTRGEYDLESNGRKAIDNEISGKPIIIHHIDSDDEDDDSAPSTPQTQSSSSNHENESSITLPDPDDFVQDPHSDPASLQATLDSLLPHDQLRHVIKAKKAFHDGWREGPITFLPTYKYDVGSMGMFDSSEKKRAPSWCDRILFRTRRDKLEYEGQSQQEELARLRDDEMKARGIDKAGDDDEVLFEYDPDNDAADDEYDENADNEDHQDEVVTREGYIDTLHLDVYTSHQRILSSDHKPLDAVFTLQYEAVVPELKSKIHQEVARDLDRAENEGRPGITIVVDGSQESEDIFDSADQSTAEDVEGVNFGDVRYLNRKTRGLTIANTGQVPAKFSFVARPSEPGEPDRITPSWLSVTFVDSDEDENERHPEKEVILEPGDTMTATLEIYVQDFTQVKDLNEDKLQLDDVLVLRVVDGRDHFVPIRGKWLQSCFARSIEELIHVPEGGVRALLSPRGGGQPVNRGHEVRWSAPRELFKFTEAVETLVERALADRDMIAGMELPESSGWPFDHTSWATNDQKSREIRRSYLLEALDTDKNLNESFPPEVPAAEKLEIICEVLLLFLDSITDGIITVSLWEKLEQSLISRKHALEPEEERTWILDVLSTAPNHNISFVFLTSMVKRVASELAPVSTSARSARSRLSFSDVRRSLSFKGRVAPPELDPAMQKRTTINQRFAEIFANVVIKWKASTNPVKEKDKERRAGEERRRDVIEVFLL